MSGLRMKILTLLAMVVALASSVAAVSAFEAHTINVTAHVENALGVSGLTSEDFGTTFPEEWRGTSRDISLSSSFQNQERRDQVSYTVYAECKEIPDGEQAAGSFYPWLLGLYLDIVATPASGTPTANSMESVGDHAAASGGPKKIHSISVTNRCQEGDIKAILTGGTLHTLLGDPTLPQNNTTGSADATDTLLIWLDTPVFEGFWNEFTDAVGCTGTGHANAKPSNLCDPTAIIGTADHRHRDDGDNDPGDVQYLGNTTTPGDFIMGVDIKIQVTCIGTKDNEPATFSADECFGTGGPAPDGV